VLAGLTTVMSLPLAASPLYWCRHGRLAACCNLTLHSHCVVGRHKLLVCGCVLIQSALLWAFAVAEGFGPVSRTLCSEWP